ncbi:MAG: GFA family protein, partial [Verrucomicrobiota bacterium]
WSPTRHFCETCGVHLTARSERAPSPVLIKVGTLDDPSVFDGPQLVTWTSEMQTFHLLPSNVPAHPEFPRPNDA